jgi:Tfp pilus assembly protein PilP
MKPTLALSMLLAISAAALAQSSTPAPKPASKATVNVKAVPQNAAKPSPANVKVVPATAKPAPVKPATVSVAPAKAIAPKAAAVNTKPVSGKPAVVAAPKPAVAAHPGVAPAAPKPGTKASKPAVAAKTPFGKPVVAVPVKSASANVVAVHDTKAAENKKPEPKKINAAGRRDPFVSPVVTLGAVGSGCSSGKRCLSIDQIALKGVVRSENGMIAVVVNAMDKAYFLRENDPVFDGYVVKITGDSIVFKETFKDKMGKPLTRDVTKTISRPVA